MDRTRDGEVTLDRLLEHKAEFERGHGLRPENVVWRLWVQEMRQDARPYTYLGLMGEASDRTTGECLGTLLFITNIKR